MNTKQNMLSRERGRFTIENNHKPNWETLAVGTCYCRFYSFVDIQRNGANENRNWNGQTEGKLKLFLFLLYSGYTVPPYTRKYLRTHFTCTTHPIPNRLTHTMGGIVKCTFYKHWNYIFTYFCNLFFFYIILLIFAEQIFSWITLIWYLIFFVEFSSFNFLQLASFKKRWFDFQQCKHASDRNFAAYNRIKTLLQMLLIFMKLSSHTNHMLVIIYSHESRECSFLLIVCSGYRGRNGVNIFCSSNDRLSHSIIWNPYAPGIGQVGMQLPWYIRNILIGISIFCIRIQHGNSEINYLIN